MIKKGIFLIFILIYIFGISSSNIFSQTEDKKGLPGESSSQTTQELQESFQNSLNQGGEASGFTEQPMDLTLPSGKKVRVQGDVKISNKKITAGKIEYENANIENAEGFEATPDGYKIASAKSLIQDGNVISGGIGITYSNGILKADHADSFISKGAISTNIDNLEAQPDYFSVEQADSVLSECVNVKNVKNSKFIIFGNAVEVSAGKGVLIDIEDCSFNNVQFESNGGRVIVGKNIPPVYRAENGKLIIKKDDYTESIDANNSVTVELDPVFGFSCMRINPEGSYWYNDKSVIKSFGIKIPANTEEYKLCIRKDISQSFDDYTSLVDFPAKKITLNKIANYLRFPFILNDINTNDYTLLEPFNLVNVYESKHKNNKAIMNLDDNFLFIDSLFIENNNPDVIGMLSYINNGEYAVYEYFNGNEVKRYGRFNDVKKPEIIKKYNSDFGKLSPEIIFTYGILAQEGINDYGTTTIVEAVCDDCIQKTAFESEMQDLSANNKIEKMCPI